MRLHAGKKKVEGMLDNHPNATEVLDPGGWIRLPNEEGQWTNCIDRIDKYYPDKVRELLTNVSDEDATALGWNPTYSLDKGLEKYIDSFNT